MTTKKHFNRRCPKSHRVMRQTMECSSAAEVQMEFWIF
jgi:hypothetical protein